MKLETLNSKLRQLVALTVAALFVLPLLLVLTASLRQPGLPPPRTIEWLPPVMTWGNYRTIFQLVPLGRYIANSAIVVALAVPITLVTASWAGFALAQLHARWQRTLVVFTSALLLVPSTALWLTRYVLFSYLLLTDTLWALIAPALMGTSPLFVLLFYWTFRRLPQELIASARIDGAGVLRTWATIAMPLARSTIIAVSVLSFVSYWSDFINPLLYLKTQRYYTLPVGLQFLQQMDRTNWPLLMAASVVMVGPVVLLFLLTQRYFWPDGRLTGFGGR
ncbi:MAG TPA: carbohydrate ABC transporter permease [Herpetosiphonaceae bacterium]